MPLCGLVRADAGRKPGTPFGRRTRLHLPVPAGASSWTSAPRGSVHTAGACTDGSAWTSANGARTKAFGAAFHASRDAGGNRAGSSAGFQDFYGNAAKGFIHTLRPLLWLFPKRGSCRLDQCIVRHIVRLPFNRNLYAAGWGCMQGRGKPRISPKKGRCGKIPGCKWGGPASCAFHGYNPNMGQVLGMFP